MPTLDVFVYAVLSVLDLAGFCIVKYDYVKNSYSLSSFSDKVDIK